MPITVRDYQHDTLEAIDLQWERGYHSTVAELFTSAGKTVIFVEYCKRKVDLSQQRILVMTPAHLILQTKIKFCLFYPEFEEHTNTGTYSFPTIGVEMADLVEPSARLIVGSVPTLIDRVPTDFEPILPEDILVTDNGGVVKSLVSKRKVLISDRVDELLRYGMIDQIIYDEAHHAVSPGSMILINRLWEICRILNRPLTKLIGFTATAYRDDGIALANIFQTICIRRNARWAEQHGYVAPMRDPIRVHAQIPLGKEDVLNATNWADLIVTAWREKGENRQTIAYLPSVEAAAVLAKTFRAAGIPAAHLQDNLTIDEGGHEHNKDFRETIYARFLTGQIKVICNYGVILEGTDLPPASCIIWARDTENIVVTTQAIGRIMRLFDGNQYLPPKEDALIIDVTGSDMTVLTAGTLAGFRVDPLTGQYIKDDVDDEEDVTISDGKDMRDTIKGVIQSSGVIYSIGKLIRKSGSDWHHDERHDVLSLSISNNDTLVIVPPYYTLANHLMQVESKLLDNLSNPDIQKDYRLVTIARDLFGNYSLWHYKQRTIPDTWLQNDISLDRLMDFTIPYMNEATNPISSFINKSSSWKRTPMSQAQKSLLTNLCQKHKLEFDPLWTQGEASQIISHLFAFNEGVRVRITQLYKAIGKYL